MAEQLQSNPLIDKSFALAVRMVNLYKYLAEGQKEFVLSKQILRCGTSIGANVQEAIGAQSDKDFLSKISIAYKEGLETLYWLKLLHAANIITVEQFQSLYRDTEEVCKIVASSQKTMKKRIAQN